MNEELEYTMDEEFFMACERYSAELEKKKPEYSCFGFAGGGFWCRPQGCPLKRACTKYFNQKVKKEADSDD